MNRHDLLVLIIAGQALLVLVMVVAVAVLMTVSRKMTQIHNELYVRKQSDERATRPLRRID